MKQYLSLLAAAVIYTACHPSAASNSTPIADTATAVKAATNERPIDSFRIANKKFLVYSLAKSSFSPASELDYDSVEGPQLTRQASKVQRKGDSLVFALKNGKASVLKNAKNPAIDEDYAVYYYAGYREDLQQHLAFGSYYESSDFLLVHPATGKQTHMWGIPHLSPDKQFVLCPSFDLEAGFNNNGFELYSYENGNMKLLGETDLQHWGPGQVKWVDAHTLEAEYQTMDTAMTIHTKPVKIVML
ncbi:hypothetical protein [Chitinophaga sancti]|uniref:hypothetical protein n=1 Tax=Chitinophaga sancti TaxID=1004 RepID=UPI003F78FC51